MLNELTYPKTLEYSSDSNHLPIEFYLTTIPHCKKIDLKLGYFSSNAIRALSYGFAQFIFNGGTLRIITNHFLSKEDKSILVEEPIESYNKSEIEKYLNDDLKGLEQIIKNGDQHFFNCLKYLHKYDRLIIQPVKLKPNGLSHYKQGFLDDGEHKIFFNGSCNFTFKGLLENGESLGISRSWGESSEQAKIEEQVQNFESIFSKENEYFEYLLVDDIVEVIKQRGQEKELEQLVEDEIDVIKNLGHKIKILETYTKQIESFEKKVQELSTTPKFPYPSGPRDYQKQAYEKWKSNNYQGIFAMATGTGKTITALNCVLNEYKQTGLIQAIILVPTNDLQRQWIKEVHKFNIKDIVVVGIESDWKKRLSKLTTNFQFGRQKSFVIISTYVSYARHTLQSFLKYFPRTTLLIADEAHNIASPKLLEVLPKTLFEKRIGLSATPKRIYDGEGTDAMNDFFNDKPPYVYSFTMEEAIAKGILCQYDYFPHIVELTGEELEEYKEITLKLTKFFDSETKTLKGDDIVTMLLMKRKRIIHKAQNKIEVFRDILKHELNSKKNLKYTFVYVPEGFDNNSQEEERIIQQYNQTIMEASPKIRVSTYTGEDGDRSFVLDSFENGKIDVLTAMKCLDEGVDVPRTELAIFCSSTGNPRQFIQRRGRILRQHDDKKHAVIHDLVVIPKLDALKQSGNFEMERSLVENELRRVADFAFMARNQYEAIDRINDICMYYDLNLYEIKESLK